MSESSDKTKTPSTVDATTKPSEAGVNEGRRSLLKSAAAAAGVAGTQAVTGFPVIWAQEIKDIELRHVGVANRGGALRHPHGASWCTRVGERPREIP